jgi:hypothetical protein
LSDPPPPPPAAGARSGSEESGEEDGGEDDGRGDRRLIGSLRGAEAEGGVGSASALGLGLDGTGTGTGTERACWSEAMALAGAHGSSERASPSLRGEVRRERDGTGGKWRGGWVGHGAARPDGGGGDIEDGIGAEGNRCPIGSIPLYQYKNYTVYVAKQYLNDI